MPDLDPSARLAGTLLCLFALCACQQTQSPDTIPAPETLPEAAAFPEQPAAAPPPADPSAQAAAVMSAPAGKPPDAASLVLTPENKPFEETATHSFGDVPAADWLGTSPGGSGPDRVLPDLFATVPDQDRVNVEGELLLDASQGTSRMLEGVGMKLRINTD
jgi:hypothetical protein